MGREPTKIPKLTIATPINAELLKKATVIPKPGGNRKPPDPRLAEVVAALRREMEAVALIASSEDREVPRFHLSEVEMDFSYAVTAVEDEGVRVMIDQKGLADLPSQQVHRLKMKIVDADVLQLTQATTTKG
jgi:hypothetical protein